jgi:hypothetical protein
MPFRNEAFDAVFCCYMLELLSADGIARTPGEFPRVLRDRGHLTLVLIGRNTAMLNAMYRVFGKVAPAIGGRQADRRVPDLMESARFRIPEDRTVRQRLYPSRVLVARKQDAGRQTSLPRAACPASRNVFGNFPVPHSLKVPKSLNQAPSGTSGSRAFHSASANRSFWETLRSMARALRCAHFCLGSPCHWIIGIRGSPFAGK